MENSFKPIYWQEGQMLLPQHFQQESFYLRGLLSKLSKMNHPHMWGHRSLNIKHLDLKNELFEISEGEFWFKDEISFCLYTDDNKTGDTIVEIKNVGDELKKKTDGDYYICLRLSSNHNVQHLESLDAKQIEEKKVSLETKFITTSSEEDLKSIHDNDEGKVFRLYHALQVVVKEPGHITMKNLLPIIKISKSRQDFWVHDKYIPPTINLDVEINKNNPLEEIIHDIQNTLQYYSDYLSPYGINIMNDGEKDDNYRLILVSLNRYIATIYHYLAEKKHIHPWDVFVVLKSMIAEFSTFSKIDEYKPCKITDSIQYNHLDLALTFGKIKKAVATILKEISARPEYIYQMNPVSNPVNIDEKIFINLTDYHFFLVFRPKLSKKSEQTKKDELATLRKQIEHDIKENILSFGIPENVKKSSKRAAGKNETFHLTYQNKSELPDLLARRSHNIYFLIQHDDMKTIQDDTYQVAMDWPEACVEDVKFFVVKRD